MTADELDFGNNGGQGTGATPPAEPVTPKVDGEGNQPATDLDKLPKDGSKPGEGEKGGEGDDKNKGNGEGEKPKDSSTGGLEAGTQVEFEGATYTVAENGDLVDAEGKVFKAAADVQAWIDSLDSADDELTIEAIQEAVGTEVVDENGKPIEFTNDPEGVKAYVKAVIETKSNEIAEGAVNKLYADNPLLRQFVDYVQLNGTARGFGDIPDRSGIQLDKDNEAQLEYIIKMAAAEFGNKSMNDAYIKYLKDTSSLYDVAKEQLAALVEKDKNLRADIEQRAAAARAQEIKDLNDYWNNVNKVIGSRLIAGYKIPDSFVKEVNGTKQTFTPDDFFNYLSKQVEVDADGNRITGYQKDLNALSDEDLLNRELLDAWLMFTGGTYKDLVDMAIKEEQVRVLRLKSKAQRSAKPVKPVIKSNPKDVNLEDIVF